jgi:hypothetical protein
MYILPATSAAPAAAVLAFVPNTGVFRPLFIAALAVVVLGAASLIVGAVAAIRRRATKA